MTRESGASTTGTEADAAVRRFPEDARLIRALVDDDASFRGLCEDLAAAERALGSIERFPEAVRSQREAEYRELADSLAKEIKDALRRAHVVPLATRRRGHPELC